MRRQPACRLHLFYSLGRYLHLQTFSHGQDRIHHLVFPGRFKGYEGTINLNLVNRQLCQVIEAGVTGAEVIK